MSIEAAVGVRHSEDCAQGAEERVWSASVMGALPPSVSAGLRATARLVELDAGQEPPSSRGRTTLGVVAGGLLRTQAKSVSGRQVTFRYARPGATIGLVALLAPGLHAHSYEALTRSFVLVVSRTEMLAAMERDPRVATAVSRELAAQLVQATDTLSAHVFDTLGSRVAAALLEMSRHTDRGLTCDVRHQDVADALGSVREVVSREMKRLQNAGLIEQCQDGVVLRDPQRLHAISCDPDRLSKRTSQ